MLCVISVLVHWDTSVTKNLKYPMRELRNTGENNTGEFPSGSAGIQTLPANGGTENRHFPIIGFITSLRLINPASHCLSLNSLISCVHGRVILRYCRPGPGTLPRYLSHGGRGGRGVGNPGVRGTDESSVTVDTDINCRDNWRRS